MTSRFKKTSTIAAAVLAVLAAYTLHAQEGKPAKGRSSPLSIEDALRQPFDFAFDKPTTLEAAAKALSDSLGLPVIIDRAALDRSGLQPDDEVQLVLKGIRLKTGLKLLLDQLDLTYRVETDDNLLVITDAVGASDPLHEVLAELKSLHRDIHELQDAVDVVQDALGITEEGGPKMRKPTIIEEVPPGKEPKEEPKESRPAAPPVRSRPGF
jgi:type II secretory pathway component GspD/PulD (secretin)